MISVSYLCAASVNKNSKINPHIASYPFTATTQDIEWAV